MGSACNTVNFQQTFRCAGQDAGVFIQKTENNKPMHTHLTLAAAIPTTRVASERRRSSDELR
jgi:hypothetical protein